LHREIQRLPRRERSNAARRGDLLDADVTVPDPPADDREG
jgi:hypothetical protein